MFAGHFVLGFERIRTAEDLFSEVGELAVATAILATIFYLVIRYLVVWFLDKD
jgi:hypothetical protein